MVTRGARGPRVRRAAWAALPLPLLLAAASPGRPPDEGKLLYRTHCASCHGPSGRGDGPLASHLRSDPGDLTQLARRNQGQYPAEAVYRTIDGRHRAEGYGTDMPVWGDAFKTAGQGYGEKDVAEKIRHLVLYLASIQEPRLACRD